MNPNCFWYFTISKFYCSFFVNVKLKLSKDMISLFVPWERIKSNAIPRTTRVGASMNVGGSWAVLRVVGGPSVQPIRVQARTVI